MLEFSPEDFWKAVILYGLNQATYKIALGKTLLKLVADGQSEVPWETLSKEFLNQYLERLSGSQQFPQQANPARLTKMEQIVRGYQTGKLSLDQAISEVGATAFNDVIHRFHNLGQFEINDSLQGMFYEFDFGKKLILRDSLAHIIESGRNELESELDARWSLLEGAFSIRHDDYQLTNDLRLTYIEKGYKRTNLTTNVPFLQGYQGNVCFYCGEPVEPSDVHVDHVLPRQVVQHDEIWNLVLCHSFCNEQKSDKLVGAHFLRKLMARNENIIGSNHPWKNKIKQQLGITPEERRRNLKSHYTRVREILGPYYWTGSPHFDPEHDSFYRRLITVLNNGSQF